MAIIKNGNVMFKYFVAAFIFIFSNTTFTVNDSYAFSVMVGTCDKDGKGDYYTYDESTRTPCKDSYLPNIGTTGDQQWITALQALPGLGAITLMVTSMDYMVQIFDHLNISYDKIFSPDFLTGIIESLVNIVSLFDITDEMSASFLAASRVYNTNQYCQYQNLYIEERDIITRQSASPGGGYAVFPVYPMDIKVKDNQCDYNTALNTYFIKGGNAATFKPAYTKCSYSYSATSDQCIKDFPFPILTTYALSYTAADTACAVLKFKSKKVKAGKKLNGIKLAEKISKTLAENAADNALSLFFDSRLAFDPFTLEAMLMLEQTMDVVINLTDYVTKFLPFGAICLGARLGVLQAVHYALMGTIGEVALPNYDKSKSALENVRFCGYDWFSYEPTGDRKYYKKGPYANSRYRAVTDCIDKGPTATELNVENDLRTQANDYEGSNNRISNQKISECSRIPLTEIICEDDNMNDDGFCKGITKYSKDIKNKIYREYLYSGVERESTIMEYDIANKLDDNRSRAIDYDYDYCIDPRLPEEKGYASPLQRYYMRGNDKANFACNRFSYNGKSGCTLPEKAIVEDSDKSRLTLIQTDDNRKYYLVREADDAEMFYKYNTACKTAFIEARKCCKYRSQHLFCLEDKREEDSESFCFSNVIDDYVEETGGEERAQTDLLNYLFTRNKDKNKVTCNVPTANVSFEGTKKTNTNYVCVFSHNLCPFDFKLNSGLNYRATYCDMASTTTEDIDRYSTVRREGTQYNATSCKEGLFSIEKRTESREAYNNDEFGAYVFSKIKEDMDSFSYNKNDFKTIYDFDKLKPFDYIGSLDDGGVISDLTGKEIETIKDVGFELFDYGNNTSEIMPFMLDPKYESAIKTSAYGQIKNFCQYRAHCVEVEREETRNLDDYLNSTFMDSSCNGASINSRNNLTSVDSSMEKQLTAPIVECIHESLKNLINGVSGTSSCVAGEVNNYGFCGADTEETIRDYLDNNNTAYLDQMYNYLTESDGTKVYLIKGEKLPEKFNPFLKIQNYFKDIIRVALTIFIVLFGFKTIFDGDMKMLKNDKGGLVVLIVKISVVLFLIFYQGWQRGIYNYIVNFSISGYNFVNSMFSSVIKNSKNTVLNLESGAVLKVVEISAVSNSATDKLMCYRYNILNDIEFRVRSDRNGCGGDNFTNKPNVEIYVRENEDFPNQTSDHLIISRNQEIEKLIAYIEEYNKENIDKLELRIKSSNVWSERLSDGNLWNSNYDGCYFDPSEYPNGKEYLAFFDTFDCKMIRYLGYTAGTITPNIFIYSLIMLLPQYFFPNQEMLQKVVSGIGSFAFTLMLTFALLMFNVLVKACYTFLSSFFVLSILILLSPIILPMMFYEKTKKIYESWYQNILGLIFRPMFNLALIMMYVNAMDIFLLDGVQFYGHGNNGRDPNLSCPENSISFFCLMNRGFGDVFDIIKDIFDVGLVPFVVDMFIVMLFFKLADSAMEALQTIISNIFAIGSANKMAGIGGVTGDKGFGTDEAYGKAKDWGTKAETFRDTYIRGGIHAAAEAGRTGIKKASNFAVMLQKDNRELMLKRKEINKQMNDKLGTLISKERQERKITGKIAEKNAKLSKATVGTKEYAELQEEIFKLNQKQRELASEINFMKETELPFIDSEKSALDEKFNELEARRLRRENAIDNYTDLRAGLSRIKKSVRNSKFVTTIEDTLYARRHNLVYGSMFREPVKKGKLTSDERKLYTRQYNDVSRELSDIYARQKEYNQEIQKRETTIAELKAAIEAGENVDRNLKEIEKLNSEIRDLKADYMEDDDNRAVLEVKQQYLKESLDFDANLTAEEEETKEKKKLDKLEQRKEDQKQEEERKKKEEKAAEAEREADKEEEEKKKK